MLRKKGGGETVLLCSPMRRAIETIRPLVAALGARCAVHPLAYEIGGLYRLARPGPARPGSERAGPTGSAYEGAAGLSSAAIREGFGPAFDCGLLPASGPWNPDAAGAAGKETDAQAVQRALRFAAWIRRDLLLPPGPTGPAGPAGPAGGPAVRTAVVVSHSDFIVLLVKALLGLPVEPDPALLTHNVSLTHLFLPAPPPAAAGAAAGTGGGGGAVLRYLNRPPECGEL